MKRKSRTPSSAKHSSTCSTSPAPSANISSKTETKPDSRKQSNDSATKSTKAFSPLAYPEIPEWAASQFPPAFASPYTREDIKQECYAELYERLPTYNPSLLDFKSWCFSQARRAAVNLHRNEHGRTTSQYRAFIPTVFGDKATPGSYKHDNDRPDYQVVPHHTPRYHDSTHQDLIKAIATLPKRSQRIALARLCGHTLKTIGETLGITESRTCVIMKHEIIPKLKELLE